MVIFESKFNVTVPKSSGARFEISEYRHKMDFSVYKMDDYNRFILFDDDVFVFLHKDESGNNFVSSNKEFNIILNSTDKRTFTVDFHIDPVDSQYRQMDVNELD